MATRRPKNRRSLREPWCSLPITGQQVMVIEAAAASCGGDPAVFRRNVVEQLAMIRTRLLTDNQVNNAIDNAAQVLSVKYTAQLEMV
jgi:hypothetical protein